MIRPKMSADELSKVETFKELTTAIRAYERASIRCQAAFRDLCQARANMNFKYQIAERVASGRGKL